MTKKRIYFLSLLMITSLIGCGKETSIDETEKGFEKVVDKIVSDENGNTGLYIKQEIEDITPTAYQPEEIDEEVEETTTTPETETETETETIKQELEEGFYETNDSVTTNHDVNIRDKGTSEGSNILGSVPSGTTITRYATNDYWSKIEYNGLVGYIYNDYIN